MHTVGISQAIIDRVLRKRGSLHAFADFQPQSTAHVVVDLQCGFMAPGQVAEVPTAREIVANVNRVSASLRELGGKIVFLQHTLDAAAAKSGWSVWHNHLNGPAVREKLLATFHPGSDGHALWPDLDVQSTDLLVNKSRYGAFVAGSSDLNAVLKRNAVDTLVVSGTTTNVCVESTAREAMMLNYKVIVVSDATAALSDEEHNASLSALLANFVDVMATEEVLKRLSDFRKPPAG